MTKRIIPILFCFLLVNVAVGAQDIIAPYDPSIPLITSADQYYSVLFDEEGEAIVSLRLTIKNPDSVPIEMVNIEIPGDSLLLMGVLQQTNRYEENTCIRWTTGCTEYGQGQTCVQYDYGGNCLKYEQPCLSYGKICEAYSTTYHTQQIYQKIDVEPIKLAYSYTLPIELITPLQENSQTNILIVYKATGYVNKLGGRYKFDFETAKLPYMTNTMRVSVDVQQDLYLKGGESNINYQPDVALLSNAMAESTKGLSAEASDRVNRYSESIVYSRGLVKTASYLDPHESFTVEGKYSRSWIWLNMGKILLTLFCIAAVIWFLVYAAKKLLAYAKDNIPAKTEKKKETHNFMVPFLSGLFTAIAISLLWVLTIIIINIADNVMSYGMDSALSILLVLLSILISLALMIGVPVYIGTRYSGMLGIFTTVSIFAWLFVFTIIIFFIAAIFYTRPVYYLI